MLLLLLSGDAGFLALHLVSKFTSELQSPLYLLTEDGSYAEFYQYVKWLWLVLVLLLCASATREKQYLAWSALFLYFLLDDSVRLHEAGGEFLARIIPFPTALGLRPQDLGEITVSAVVAAPILLVIAWAVVRGSASFRRTSLNLALGVVVLFGVGVVTDLVHQALQGFDGRWMNSILGLVEDGGEMLAATAMLCLALDALRLARPDGHDDRRESTSAVRAEHRPRVSPDTRVSPDSRS